MTFGDIVLRILGYIGMVGIVVSFWSMCYGIRNVLRGDKKDEKGKCDVIALVLAVVFTFCMYFAFNGIIEGWLG